MRMTVPWRHLATALLALMMGTGVAHAQAKKPLNIRIAWSTMPGHLIPVLYSKPEILKHYGKTYTVEPIRFRGSSPQLTALAANEIDLATLGPVPFALGVVNAHLDLMALADVFQDGVPGYQATPYMVRKDSGINTVQDLRGKRIATNAIGSAADTALRAMLIRSGLDPKRDVNIIEVQFSNMPAMLEEKKVDLGAMARPFSTQLMETGRYKVLFNGADAYGGKATQAVFLAGRESFIKSAGPALQDFFEDHVRALRWFQDPANRKEALDIVAKFVDAKPESLPDLFTKEDTYRDPWVVPDVEGIQLVIDAAVKLNVVPKGIQVSPKYVDLSFVKEARRRIEQDGTGK